MSPDLYQWRHSAPLWADEICCLRCWSSLAGREDGLNARLFNIYIECVVVVGLAAADVLEDENRRS
ncbi:hypothetical protein [Bacillus vallismortis]|uniref:hypothetical protein n=1 Tax=Bacillus vallismortis TaxID=72361 RepID=UPI0002EB6965|nr:hypothetical protein [Bacillus vallismortis]MCY7891921.1 hypothetical protein [Bacillus vallismortis]MCY8535067.1 hypothetical protein [Bacillus vallismortis]MEC1267629.1 hypothetical protein [Bacillus vallismortis]